MSYKTIDNKDIEFLKSVVENDEERILVGNNISEEYSHDELAGIKKMPDVVLKVKSTEEVSKIMKYAFEHTIPVTPRGSGTGLVGAAVPVLGGIVIDMTLMNNILELDEENLTLTVEPGVLLMEIAKYVEDNGLFYPPDPGEKTATIGGNISTNAGGMRAVKYGVTRDYVRGLEVVLPNGEIVNFGGKVVKNSSGYSLKDLIVGSEGTLGIVTKAILKLLPHPDKTLSLLVPFPNLDMAIETVPKIIKAKVIPTAVEFMERDVILASEQYLGKKFPDHASGSYLLLTFDGKDKKEIEDTYDYVAKICLDCGALDVLISDTEERQTSIWQARGSFLEAIKGSTTDMDEVDVVVPRNKVAEFVKFTNQLEKTIGIRIRSFGHAGDGNLHVYILKDELDEATWKEKLNKAMDEMYKKSNELAGKVSGEHGIGYAKMPYLEKAVSEESLTLMRGIKSAFDPKDILNPQKLF